MWLLRITVCTLALQLDAIQFIDLPVNYENTAKKSETNVQRRNWIHQRQGNNDSEATPPNESTLQTTTPTPEPKNNPPANDYKNLPADSKDENLKSKISTLVLQTVHDTERRMKTVNSLKAKFKNKPPYKIGFILSLIKKSRDVMNELFNVAVKHREKWKALEELKIFELIVHTNVDTTNLVRRLVEEHVNFLNTTNPNSQRKGVFLM